MGRRELEDVAECGPGRGDVAVSQVLIERRRVELSATADPRVLEQGLELRGEHELAIRPRIEQRLLADPIAGQEQESPPLVPDREGEHAAKPPQASRPILLEGMDDDLGVAPGGEPVSVCLQLGAQLEEIVDLAVERHPDRAVLVAHRLPAAGQVDDAEPALAEADVALDVEPLVVGAAMREAGARRSRTGCSTARPFRSRIPAMPHIDHPSRRIHLTTEHTERHGKNEDLENPSFDLSLGIV